MSDPLDEENARHVSVVETQPLLRPSVLWVGILLTYLALFSVSGYIAFFQEPYNPASNPSQQTVDLMKIEEARPALLESLQQESEAFKARRDLAGQSFNVVLGAMLGFLSASAAQGVLRRHSA